MFVRSPVVLKKERGRDAMAKKKKVAKKAKKKAGKKKS